MADDDQRFQRLEQQLAILSMGHDRMLKQMTDFFQAVHSREEASASQPGDARQMAMHNQTGGVFPPRYLRLDFPVYNGAEDPTIWICGAEQFFDFQNVAEAEKVRLASYYLEGDAQIWIQRKNTLNEHIDWARFKRELMLRFGSAPYEDGFGELCKLKQTSTVRDYQSRFERLLSKAGVLTAEQETACFISGLRDSLQADVKAHGPTALASAITLARIYEGRNQSTTKWASHPRPTSTPRPSFPSSNRRHESEEKSASTPEFPVRRFTPSELQQRRAQGLCFHCDERYTPNHTCKRLFWIEMEEDEADKDNVDDNDQGTAWEKPEIFLNSLVGITTPQTMRVAAKVGKIPLTILIDSGSTHNFLHTPFARIAALHTEANSALKVIVANGEKIRSPGLCREVTLHLQESQFLVDLYLIELEGCDAVLGAQWLRTLGPIIWDFDRMEMTFSVNQKETRLVGMGRAPTTSIGAKAMNKALRVSSNTGMLLQIRLLTEDVMEKQDTDDWEPWARKYPTVFGDLQGLPPRRNQDHRIPLLPGSGPVSLRPY
ncbi:hypothetical protein L484_006138 [Morus notabilis]|uniref:Retrotransposon gag domain-containing protein n=1 Tax=Morus notabilis TaxID=981085 RepID=W9QXW9_9ROSA|nr:uncharacterized protein LOC21389578 [Morus notabilis]EXB28516.1 hypothetical protein L484_006138 [Morus notabilis]